MSRPEQEDVQKTEKRWRDMHRRTMGELYGRVVAGQSAFAGSYRVHYSIRGSGRDNDRAHGYTHLDVLDMHGRVDRKEYRDHITVQQAIRHAIDDFQENWSKYADHCFSGKGRKTEIKGSRNRG